MENKSKNKRFGDLFTQFGHEHGLRRDSLGLNVFKTSPVILIFELQYALSQRTGYLPRYMNCVSPLEGSGPISPVLQ